MRPRIGLVGVLGVGLGLACGLGWGTSSAGEGRMNEVVAGNNRFAVELYRAIAPGGGNRFVSPYSLSTALAMTLGGARGQTAQEMVRTLHLPGQDTSVHAAFAELARSLDGAGEKRPYQLDIANALWGQRGAQFVPEFLDLLKRQYGSTVHAVDFQGDTAGAIDAINTWVEAQTQDRIQDLLHSGDVTPDTELVLTNAISFKGRWAQPFQATATRPVPFRRTGADPVEVPTMHRTGRLGYVQGEGFRAVELPYEGNALSMLVVLPDAIDGLGAVEQTLDFAWVDRIRPQPVALALPRFKAEYRVELARPLAALGMPSAFSGDADFSGISTEAKLALSQVIHQAFVDVNEEGTEAAAATAVIAARTSVAVAPPIEFRVDHPFLFAIRHQPSGSILFLGRITDPGR